MHKDQLNAAMARIPVRSMGLKLLFVCALALAMTIPAMLVFALVYDRTQRADQVRKEISGLTGGPQTYLGPMLAIPYWLNPSVPGAKYETGLFVIAPARSEATVSTTVELRHRSLFKVPVYQSDVAFKSDFEVPRTLQNLPQNANLDWSRAELLVGASDARGALNDAIMVTPNKTQSMVPSGLLDAVTLDIVDDHNQASNSFGGQAQGGKMQLFSASAAGVASPGESFTVSSSMKFAGAMRVAVLANGKNTNVTIRGDWANPSFDGGFLPVQRNLGQRGFQANWSIPFLARGVPGEGGSEVISHLSKTAMGVSFLELADPYQSVNRSLKYAPLFIGLVFLAYFVLEVRSGKRMHPAQYVLVGVAQVIFYLLLLSIAERVGFDFAFAIAAFATVTLISVYAKWVFADSRHGIAAAAVFSALYLLIYLLMRLEDQALLIGAVASFAAIALVMYVTRGIDWYGSAPYAPSAPEPVLPSAETNP